MSERTYEGVPVLRAELCLGDNKTAPIYVSLMTGVFAVAPMVPFGRRVKTRLIVDGREYIVAGDYLDVLEAVTTAIHTARMVAVGETAKRAEG